MKKIVNLPTLLFLLIMMSLLSCEKEDLLPTAAEPTVKWKPEKKIATQDPHQQLSDSTRVYLIK